MKDIGLKLKEKREENGVSIEEAAEDLKLRPSQIVSIEEGKKEDFDDVFYLKYFIRYYAKYLGLDGEELVDEFNEYLFDYTSKIPLDAIEKAKKSDYKIIYKCDKCGSIKKNIMASDDNMDLIIEIMANPIKF